MISLPSHRTLLITASLLWMFSFGAEVTYYQPYSTIGIYVAPPLMLLGLIQFVRFRRRRASEKQLAWQAWQADPDNVPQPDVRDPNIVIWIILGFWTTSIIFWMGLVWLGGGIFRNSEAFLAAKAFSAADSIVIRKTGGVRSFGILVGGTITFESDSASAKLSFTAVGKDHNVPIYAELIKTGGTWQLKKLESSDAVN